MESQRGSNLHIRARTALERNCLTHPALYAAVAGATIAWDELCVRLLSGAVGVEAVVRQDLGVAVQPSGAEIEATWALAAVLLQGYAHEDAAAGTCCGTVGDPESSALLCVLQCAAHLPVPCNVFRHVMVCAPHSFKHTCAHFHTHTQVAVRVAER